VLHRTSCSTGGLAYTVLPSYLTLVLGKYKVVHCLKKIATGYRYDDTIKQEFGSTQEPSKNSHIHIGFPSFERILVALMDGNFQEGIELCIICFKCF